MQAQREFGLLALREDYFAQACLIDQQSAERALKSLVYASGERLVIGHSLVELVERLRDRLPALDGFRETAGLLDQYYISTRHPNGLTGGLPFEAFSERQAREAVAEAGMFVGVDLDRPRKA